MEKAGFFINTAFIKTKDLQDRRDLACGKLEGNDPSGSFLFYLLELEDVESNQVNRKILQILTNSVKTADVLSPEIFDNCLQLINETLGRLAENGNDSWLGHLNAVIGLIQDDEILISQTGSVVGYIFRKNKISALTERTASEGPAHPHRIFTDVTSGQISKDDQLVFSNNEFLNVVSLDRLRNTIKLADARREAKELCHLIQKSHSSEANSIIIQITDEISESDEEIPNTYYADEAPDNIGKSLERQLAPILESFWEHTQIYFAAAVKYSKIYYKKAKVAWHTTYGPKSKEILSKSGVMIKTNLSEAKKKIGPQIEKFKEREEFRKLKIKAIPYSKTPKRNLSPYLQNIVYILSQTKVVFYRDNRKFLYIGLIVIALLVGYSKIKINNDHKAEQAQKLQVANAYDQANSLFAAARDDLALGKTTSLDKLYEARTLAEKAKSDPGSSMKAVTLIKEINAIVDEKSKTVRIYDAVNGLLAQNTTKITLAGSEIYGVAADGKIYKMDVRDRESQLIASLSLGSDQVTNLTYASASNKIFIITTNKIFALDIANGTVEEPKIAAGSAWEKSVSVASYVTNLYLLDSTTGNVWKHILKDSEYSKGSTYTDTKKVSLKSAVDLAVDGNIYVLTSGGAVDKFVKGALEQDFSLKNIPAPDNKIASPAKIFTDDSTNSIFILDKAANRIIKFDKSGAFTNQYVFDGLSIDSFVVDAKLQKIWALSAGKIYEGNL